ncbi:hypothetical protein ACFL49_02310 [Candidatus Omnitrophota bacterium]
MKMKKRIVLICFLWVSFLALSFNDCSAEDAVRVGTQKNLTNIHLIYVGMPQEETLAVMGDKMKKGYQVKDKKKGFFEPVYIRHPYRKEKFRNKGKAYQVYYFFTKIMIADDIVADDELTPVVFEGGVVVAKGWDALLALKEK